MKELQVVLKGDLTVTFRLPLFLEATVDVSSLEEKAKDDLDWWASHHAVFPHRTELEYLFPMIPTDKNYLKKMEVPNRFRDVFRAAMKEAEKQEDEHGTVYLLLRFKE
jgi:hypothetical protein